MCTLVVTIVAKEMSTKGKLTVTTSWQTLKTAGMNVLYMSRKNVGSISERPFEGTMAAEVR